MNNIVRCEGGRPAQAEVLMTVSRSSLIELSVEQAVEDGLRQTADRQDALRRGVRKKQKSAP